MSAYDEAVTIEGFISEQELALLADLAADRATIIEVGSWKGRSTKALTASPGVVYAVDNWSGKWGSADPGFDPNVFEDFAANLADEIAAGQVVPVCMDSVAAAEHLAGRGVLADMIFIDAEHTEDAVAADIDACLPLLRPGGLLCGHDWHTVDWPGVVRAVQRYQFPNLEVRYTIWMVRR